MDALRRIVGERRIGDGLPVSEHLMLIEPMQAQRALCMEVSDVVEIGMASGPIADLQRAGIPVDKVGSTAVVPVVGLMNKRMAAPGFLASYLAVEAAVTAAAADDSVKTILLQIDSPGGFVSGVAEAADAVHRAAQVKPVVAQVDGMAASAAYWIGSQATEMMGGRLDRVGSIGVLAVVYDTSKMAENMGVKTEVFTTGKFKAAGLDGTSLTDEQRKEIQANVDSLGQAFIADVARGRNMGEDAVAKVADGRVFDVPTAVTNGLADGVSTMGKTLQRLEMARAREDRRRRARLRVALDS